MTQTSPTFSLPKPLFLFALLYGGMTVLAGVLGAKQVALGPLAVEAGIFAFLMLVVLSSTVAQLYGRPMADRLVLFGFVPLAMSIVQRLNEKDLKGLATDRNAKEGLRLLAKKMLTKGKV